MEEKLHENGVWGPNREVPFLSCILASMLSCFSHIQLCVTPWTVAHQASWSVGFSRQEHWSGVPCPPPEDLPDKWFVLKLNSLFFQIKTLKDPLCKVE